MAGELSSNLLDGRGLKARAIINKPEPQRPLEASFDGQRIMRRVRKRGTANVQFRERLLQGGGHRLVPERDDAVEQRRSRRHGTPSLDVDERGVFVLAQPGV